MPLDLGAIGLQTAAFVHPVDARWTMAYAACLGDANPLYFDTTRESGVVGHPLFAICPEWPVALASRAQFKDFGVSADELRRAVHARHDCHMTRLICPGDELTTRSTVLSIECRPPGAYISERFDTSDADGLLVAQTFHSMFLLGVDVTGDRSARDNVGTQRASPLPAPPLPASAKLIDGVREQRLSVPGHLAHTYSECARIWNPVHTDLAVALAAGLPDIILHGSATLALAVSDIVAHEAAGEPQRVARLGCEFRGMVRMPAQLRLVVGAGVAGDDGICVPFAAYNEQGEAALSHGHVTLRHA